MISQTGCPGRALATVWPWRADHKRQKSYIATGEVSAENQLIWELLRTRNFDSACTGSGCRSKLGEKAAFHID